MPTRAAPTLAIIATLVTAADLGAQFTPHAVWGTSSDDVWAVMAQSAPLRFGAGRWEKIALAAEPTLALFAVWGSGPSDVFIGGESLGAGAILRWNGSDWSAMAVPTRSPIIALAGRSPTDAFALARTPIPGRTPSVLAWDGRTWTETALPQPFWAAGMAVRADEVLVAGWIDPTQGMATTSLRGVFARLRAGRWTVEDWSGSPHLVGVRWETVLALGDTVFLVGAVGEGRLIAASWGAGWTRLSSPGGGRPGVHLRLAFLAGDGTLVALLDGGGGMALREPNDRWTTTGAPDPYNPPPTMSRDELLRLTLAWEEVNDARAAWGPSGRDFYLVTGSGRVVRFTGGMPSIVFDVSCLEPSVAARSPVCRMLAPR